MEKVYQHIMANRLFIIISALIIIGVFVGLILLSTLTCINIPRNNDYPITWDMSCAVDCLFNPLSCLEKWIGQFT